jgi:S1-C subfamily serine protease
LLGDAVLSVAGEPVADIRALLAVLAGNDAGRTVELRIVRAGKLETLTATLGSRK